MAVRIEGVSRALSQLDASPKQLEKLVEQSMRNAGKQVVSRARGGIPSKYRRLMKCKIIPGRRMMSGNTSAIIGMFKGKNRGDGIPLWFKAYWANYGTLSKRDPSHTFVSPVKKATKYRRNNVGQEPQRFFDDAMQGWDRTMAENFQREMQQKKDELIK